MIREIYSVSTKKTTLSVMNTKVSAILKSSTVKTGLRLYENGYIGVAGAIGAYNEEKLLSHAKQMLNFQIPYDCEPTKNMKRTVDLTENCALNVSEFVEKSETLLRKLGQAYPNFSFSHKIILEEVETRLHNDLGVALINKDKLVKAELLIKHSKSKNLMDGIGAYHAREFDLEAAFNAISESCAVFEEKISVPDAKMPVIMLLSPEIVLEKFYTDLNGRAMGTGASMFAGKLGEKLFSDDFTLYVEHSPDEFQCFFDAEGTVLLNDRFALIENGVLLSPFSSKKIAKEYGYAVTGSGGGEYDSVPNLSEEGINFKTSGKTIHELLAGRKAIYIAMASGGDFTAQGEYASPIQAAYCWEDGKITGRLPQMSMSSHIYEMFGKDFIGLSTDGNAKGSPFKYLAMEMNISTIGDWM